MALPASGEEEQTTDPQEDGAGGRGPSRACWALPTLGCLWNELVAHLLMLMALTT